MSVGIHRVRAWGLAAAAAVACVIGAGAAQALTPASLATPAAVTQPVEQVQYRDWERQREWRRWERQREWRRWQRDRDRGGWERRRHRDWDRRNFY